MKLRNKTFIAIGMAWIIFLGLAYAGANLLAASLLCFIAIIWLLRKIFLSRFEKLDHDLTELNDNNELAKHIETTGNDELSHLAQQVNRLMDRIETCVDERTEELLESNHHLKQEISEQKTIEKELITHREHLLRLAHYDSLTSLPNRVFFHEILNKTILNANRHKKMMAILFIDLDRFKSINDTYGHATGDIVLKEIAERFTAVLRSDDILARLGGDEFIILLNDIDHTNVAGTVAEKLLTVCAKPVVIDHNEFIVTTSIGICTFPHDGDALEELQKNADMAMYQAKRTGGNTFNYFSKDMNTDTHDHTHLETSLQKAIQNNEFILHYQPKFDLKQIRIHGVEALIRWENPEAGLISPTKFIPLAEEAGLMMAIGEWTLREACRINKSWQTLGFTPITLSVNLSQSQFCHPDIIPLITTVLADTGLNPNYLELEISEKTLMTNTEQAIATLNDMKKMGLHISVDDFGTGYTSISYLKQLPVSILKIDRSFIKGIPDNQDDLAITNAAIALAHSLGMKVVAEGVETVSQLKYLAMNGCDVAQGYYFSRPLPASKIILQFGKENISTEI